MNQAKVYEKKVIIPTYKAGEPEANPLFIEKRAYQGSTGKVYPLPVTEKISDVKEDVEYNALILENDYLYVMILPELGGRIQRAYDKTNGYDFVYYNHVIKPALVGLAGPWISGGIEFNWPQHHRPSTFMPVDYTFRENPDGSATVIIGETDRMNGTKGNALITLYPDKAYIEIRGRLYNPTDYPQTFLWWANPAVSVNDQTFSVFPPDVNAVMDHGKRAVSTFPIATGEYYKADYSAGVDISRYKNIRVPTSYMAAHSDYDFVGNYDEGMQAGLLHVADHHVSPGKKQWTWGCGDFGKTWDKNLTDEDGPYIELMTGVFCDNQPDFTWLKPQEEKNFVQYFMPYRAVGRVTQATKDLVLGVDYLDEDGMVIEPSPFAYGEEANLELASRAACGRIKLYSSGICGQLILSVFSGNMKDPDARRCELYRKTIDLAPGCVFMDTIPGLCAYDIRVTDEAGRELLSCREYVKMNRPIPSPQEAMKKPSEIQSLEELYLAGQHLEQYRHATFLPADYYLEGLRRDPTDIRLNNAYGLLLLRSGRIAESVRYFYAAIEKQTRRNPNPYYGEAYFNYGLALSLSNGGSVLLDKAYDAFYKATWSAETAGPAFYHLACIAVRKGKLREALAFSEEALLRQYHNMKVRGLRATVLHALLLMKPENEKLKGEYQAFLRESEKIDPLYFPIRYRIDDPESFRKVMGDRLENYLNLAYEFLEYGFPENAKEVLLSCPMEGPMKYYTLAYCLSRDGEFINGEDNERIEEAQKYRKLGEQTDPACCFPNRVIEQQILQANMMLGAEKLEDAPAMAHYYLGELLYDKKRYKEAVENWQTCTELKPDFAPAHRNLSIAYYNHKEVFANADKNGVAADAEFRKLNDLAREENAKACLLEPNNSRFLLEQDQLLKKLEVPVAERLAILEEHREILSDRYALMLAYVSLLNADGQYEKALDLLMHYTFHVWEGGEGKVADEYKTALLSIAEQKLSEDTEAALREAIALAERSLSYPDNLGEGKLDNVPDNQAWYLMGCAYRKLQEEQEAENYFRKASEGDQIPAQVRYYNDQPSDYIYYQGLAFHALGNDEMAKKSFHQLIIYGEQHLFDAVGYDFFAVSMPELEVYQDDIEKRSRDYCRRLITLGQKGLSEISS